MDERQFYFDWDEAKAAANGLTVADLEHGEAEERWFSVGRAANGSLLSVAYLWSETKLENPDDLSA